MQAVCFVLATPVKYGYHKTLTEAVVVPQEATFEIQDKVFVFAVGDSNKVASKPITVSGKSVGWYFVQSGLKPGEKIVFSGAGNLQDGMVIVPQPISVDSLLKSKTIMIKQHSLRTDTHCMYLLPEMMLIPYSNTEFCILIF